MLHLLIKRAGKQLGISLIISLCSAICSGQQNLKPIDSIALKSEIDQVLAKYGLRSKGFVINVISLKQKGGQTAYSITNNFYGDTVRASTNFGYLEVTEDSVKYIYVYPRRGTWLNPFVGYDSLLSDVAFDPGVGFSSYSNQSIPFNNPFTGKKHLTM